LLFRAIARLSSCKMPLLPDRIRLPQKAHELCINVFGRRQPKMVHVVSCRDRFDFTEPAILESSGQDDVAVEPPHPRRDLRERHPGLKGDPSFLGQNSHRPDLLNRSNNRLKQVADLRRLTREMRFQVVASAEMELIAISELPSAIRTPPQSSLRARSSGLFCHLGCTVSFEFQQSRTPRSPPGRRRSSRLAGRVDL
jgi:hypothetical protein